MDRKYLTKYIKSPFKIKDSKISLFQISMHKDEDLMKIQMCTDTHTESMFQDHMGTIKRPPQLINSAVTIRGRRILIHSILKLIFQFASTFKTSSSCLLGALTAFLWKRRPVSISLHRPLQRNSTTLPITQYLGGRA